MTAWTKTRPTEPGHYWVRGVSLPLNDATRVRPYGIIYLTERGDWLPVGWDIDVDPAKLEGASFQRVKGAAP